jgi:hypothetical protein
MARDKNEDSAGYVPEVADESFFEKIFNMKKRKKEGQNGMAGWNSMGGSA